jgi:hypothetical protein
MKLRISHQWIDDLKGYLFLAFFFFSLLNFFSLIVRDDIVKTRERELNETQKIEAYAQELTENVIRSLKETGRKYSPYEYYYHRSMVAVEIRKRGFALGSHYYPLALRKLHELGKQGLYDKTFSDADSKAAGSRFNDDFLKKDASTKQAKLSLNDIANFLISQYKRNLIFAFFLFILWDFEENKKKRRFIAYPFRLIFRTALYPAVIAYYIEIKLREILRETAAEAELRRSSPLLGKLAPWDVARLTAYAKSKISFAEWKRQLAVSGYKPQHSFAAAFLVSLVFVIAIRPAEAGAKKFGNLLLSSNTLEQTEKCNNLARMSIDNPDAKKIPGWKWVRDLIICGWKLQVLQIFRQILLEEIRPPLKIIERKVDHIPILAVQI